MRLLRGLSLLVYKHRSEQLKWGRLQDHWRKGTRNLKNIVNWERKLPRFFSGFILDIDGELKAKEL